MFLVLVGRDEDDLQFVLMFRGFLKFAVKLTQAGVELLARGVLAAAKVEPDQGQPAAQRLHVHLGLLTVDQPLSEQTHQELRHPNPPTRRTLLLSAERCIQSLGWMISENTLFFLHRWSFTGEPGAAACSVQKGSSTGPALRPLVHWLPVPSNGRGVEECCSPSVALTATAVASMIQMLFSLEFYINGQSKALIMKDSYIF